MCKRFINEGRPFDFHGFWSEEVHCKKRSPNKKILIFEHYDLINPMEHGAKIFGGQFSRK
jgi:hypothetical protein